MTNKIELIAADFSRRIRAYLTPEQMSAVIARNQCEPNPSICHSHDDCDANAFMQEAFEQVSGRPVDLHSDSDDFIVWASWEIAKQTKFSTSV